MNVQKGKRIREIHWNHHIWYDIDGTVQLEADHILLFSPTAPSPLGTFLSRPRVSRSFFL